MRRYTGQHWTTADFRVKLSVYHTHRLDDWLQSDDLWRYFKFFLLPPRKSVWPCFEANLLKKLFINIFQCCKIAYVWTNICYKYITKIEVEIFSLKKVFAKNLILSPPQNVNKKPGWPHHYILYQLLQKYNIYITKMIKSEFKKITL